MGIARTTTPLQQAKDMSTGSDNATQNVDESADKIRKDIQAKSLVNEPMDISEPITPPEKTKDINIGSDEPAEKLEKDIQAKSLTNEIGKHATEKDLLNETVPNQADKVVVLTTRAEVVEKVGELHKKRKRASPINNDQPLRRSPRAKTTSTHINPADILTTKWASKQSQIMSSPFTTEFWSAAKKDGVQEVECQENTNAAEEDTGIQTSEDQGTKKTAMEDVHEQQQNKGKEKNEAGDKEGGINLFDLKITQEMAREETEQADKPDDPNVPKPIPHVVVNYLQVYQKHKKKKK